MNMTKSLTFAKNPVRCKLVVQDKIIEQVSQFKYLGMDLSSEGPKKLDQQSICHVGLLKADNIGERIHAKG